MSDYKPHPLRIQRKRTKGYRLPKGAICVSRPSKWGNPFRGPGAVSAYRSWITTGWRHRVGVAPDGQAVECVWLGSLKASVLRAMLPELRGKKLACWCPLDRPCHADVLCELANPPEGDSL